MQRNCHQLVPYMVFLGIGILISFLQLLSGTLDALINFIVTVVVNGYLLVCINSLYLKFQRQSKCKISQIQRSFAWVYIHYSEKLVSKLRIYTSYHFYHRMIIQDFNIISQRSDVEFCSTHRWWFTEINLYIKKNCFS